MRFGVGAAQHRGKAMTRAASDDIEAYAGEWSAGQRPQNLLR